MSGQRTVKVALVLYGGVSLAVYENGVTRCFYDLVKGRGVFGPLRQLLDSDAEVDVIAGTSAGGINGLILAAALESGQDFAQSAKIWRELGDFGALLRSVYDGDAGKSLLQGETYYRDQLIEGFRRFCTPIGDHQGYRHEIDVFVTGTEIDGTLLKITDVQGHEIADKTHRAVFHLKHRPGRRYLGLPNIEDRDAPKPVEEQAHILAAMARITSCFPAAFPPFTAKEMTGHEDAVVQAIRSLGRPSYSASSAFLDGGLLDNKPFGHALNAIFYRMPTGVVDRRLFFVEPDPVPFETAAAAQPGPGKPAPERKPLQTVISALTKIRGHESIHGDLDALTEHNAKIGYLETLRDRLLADLPTGDAQEADGPPPPHWRDPVYRKTRIESLARLVAGTDDQAPTADRMPRDRTRRLLVMTAIAWFGEGPHSTQEDRTTADQWIERVDLFDIDFVRRFAFFLLYQYYEALKTSQRGEKAYESTKAESRERLSELIRAIGWHVEILEVIRAALQTVRESLPPDPVEGPDPEMPSTQAEAEAISEGNWARLLFAFASFLRTDDGGWDWLIAHMTARQGGQALRAWATEGAARLELGKAELDGLWQRAGARPLPSSPDDLKQALEAPTILGAIRDALGQAVEQAAAEGLDAWTYESFVALDRQLYPLTFAAGVHELDRIEFVRISPADAQREASKLDANLKIAGDELAHFSAFLRRDWRSNDLLWGRLDGTCQIVESLLDETAFRRLRRRGLAGDEIDLSALDGLGAGQTRAREALAAARALWGQGDAENPSRATLKAERALTDALIAAGQQIALKEDLPAVYEDRHYQDIEFGRITPTPGWSGMARRLGVPARMQTGANEGAKDVLAEWLAEREADRAGPDLGENFVKLELGAEPVTQALPRQVIGEYGSRVFLLFWAMLEASLGKHAQFLKGPIRRYIRLPILFANRLFVLMREETVLAAVIIAVVAALLLGGTVYSVAEGHYGRAGALFLGFLAFSWLFTSVAVESWRLPISLSVILAVVLALVVVFVLLAGFGCFAEATWDWGGLGAILESLWHALKGVPECIATKAPTRA